MGIGFDIEPEQIDYNTEDVENLIRNTEELIQRMKNNNSSLKSTQQQETKCENPLEELEKDSTTSNGTSETGKDRDNSSKIGEKFNNTIEEFLSKPDANLLDMIGIIEKNGKIESSKRIATKLDINSRKRKHFQMNSFTDCYNTSFIDRVMPNYNYKLATQQLQVQKTYITEQKIQSLVLLIDDSGSMVSKIDWVKALLYNRLRQVIEGKAELFICTFEEELHNNWLIINSPEKAKYIWNRFDEYFTFDLGDTDMQLAVEDTIKMIYKGEFIDTLDSNSIYKMNGERPQICLINDGADYVDESFIPTLPVHGMILNGKNEEMKRFCNQSGGSYREFY